MDYKAILVTAVVAVVAVIVYNRQIAPRVAALPQA